MASQKYDEPRVHLAAWSWTREDGFPVITADFSQVSQPAGEEDAYAVAKRHLKHIGILQDNFVARTEGGEVYNKNLIEDDDSEKRIRIVGAGNCSALINWTAKHDKPLNKAIRHAAALWNKKYSRKTMHHKNYATWSAETLPDGTPVLVADFSHLAEAGIRGDGMVLNPHYWGAKKNIEAFKGLTIRARDEKYQVKPEEAAKEPQVEMFAPPPKPKAPEDVIFSPPKFGEVPPDDTPWKITIVGTGNCTAFMHWIAREDPDLTQHLAEQNIQPWLSLPAAEQSREAAFSHAVRVGKRALPTTQRPLFSSPGKPDAERDGTGSPGH